MPEPCKLTPSPFTGTQVREMAEILRRAEEEKRRQEEFDRQLQEAAKRAGEKK